MKHSLVLLISLVAPAFGVMAWFAPAAMFAPAAIAAPSNSECVANPDWGIFITDYGYADTMVDLRELDDLDLRGREYLSGEFAHAIGYTKASIAQGPLWLEPEFIFPDWTTNSNFSVVSAIAFIGNNAGGQPIYESTISNGDLEVKVTSEMLDTLTPYSIRQGMTPASAGAVSVQAVFSSRYVLRQTYTLKNISGVTLSNINTYQMLHGLFSLAAVYDDRVYPGATGGDGPMGFDASHHYDTTVMGEDDQFGSFVDPSPCLPSPISLGVPSAKVSHLDILTLHSSVAPAAIDSGYYGDQGAGDIHEFFKPSVGTHLNIESGTLNGLDFFDPGDADYPPYILRTPTYGETDIGDVWVAGAQKHSLGSLAAGQSVSIDYLLSVHSHTFDNRSEESVPIPVFYNVLLFLALLALARRAKNSTL